MTSHPPADEPASDPPPARNEPPSFDISRAHPARIYDYWLGGRDNYEADRVAAELAIYVDSDPIVLAHARALLDSTPQGATAYIQADARDPAAILREAGQTLDFSRPVAVMLLMIMQYIPDADGPGEIVSRLAGAVPAGSYLALSTVTRDIAADRITEGAARLNQRMGPASISLRTRAEIAGFFDGLELVEPGLVHLPEWRAASTPGTWMPAYAGVARKP